MAVTNSTVLVIFVSFLSLMVIASATPGTYSYNPNPKPKFYKPNLDFIAIQGLIYCKSGPKLIPLKGAVARITCLSVDKSGYESAPFSVLSCPTDAKGYFLAKLSSLEMKENAWKLHKCKGFLESSPLESCKCATDINNGTTGALLTSFKLLKNMKLYSLAPFVYSTSQPKPVSKGY